MKGIYGKQLWKKSNLASVFESLRLPRFHLVPTCLVFGKTKETSPNTGKHILGLVSNGLLAGQNTRGASLSV